MLSFNRESLLYDPVATYKRRKTFRLQLPELPFFEYRIDLFAFSKRLGRTLAVELKLARWQRALEQATIYQLCADLSYIAIPLPVIKRVDRDLLQEAGIGLISVDHLGRCREVLAATQSQVVRAFYRDAYIKILQGQS